MAEEDTSTIVHESVHPSRGGMPGETAFLTAWQELMAEVEADDERHDPLLEVHSPRWARDPACDQADATLAATLVQWLGTNAGACMIQLARSLQAKGLFGPDAFRAAWAVTNARKRATNSDLRTIETLMVPPDAPRGFDGTPYKAPGITLRQYETAEHVCAWLGTGTGQDFIAARESEIEAFRAHERIQMREANRNGSRPPHGMSQQGIAEYRRILRRATSEAEGRRGAA